MKASYLTSIILYNYANCIDITEQQLAEYITDVGNDEKVEIVLSVLTSLNNVRSRTVDFDSVYIYNRSFVERLLNVVGGITVEKEDIEMFSFFLAMRQINYDESKTGFTVERVMEYINRIDLYANSIENDEIMKLLFVIAYNLAHRYFLVLFVSSERNDKYAKQCLDLMAKYEQAYNQLNLKVFDI